MSPVPSRKPSESHLSLLLFQYTSQSVDAVPNRNISAKMLEGKHCRTQETHSSNYWAIPVWLNSIKQL